LVNEQNDNLVTYFCVCDYSTANTQQNFFFTLPSNLPDVYTNIDVLATISTPQLTANHKTTVFATTASGKLRIGILSDVVQKYNIAVMFVKRQGSLTISV
jgi:hypothetical protein